MAAPAFDAQNPELVNLLETCPIVPGATVSRPLVNMAQGKVVVFAMDAGQEISEHRAPMPATVQVVDGLLSFSVGGRTREMAPGDWIILPANAPHGLIAIKPTRFVLVLFKLA